MQAWLPFPHAYPFLFVCSTCHWAAVLPSCLTHHAPSLDAPTRPELPCWHSVVAWCQRHSPPTASLGHVIIYARC